MNRYEDVNAKRLDELENRSSKLQMSSSDRKALWADVMEYCEEFLDYLDEAPAASPLGDRGRSLLEAPFSEEGIPVHEALNILDKSVDRLGLNVAAPGFLSYVPVSPVFPAMLSDLLAAVSSRYAGHFNAGPGAVQMEHMVLRWMADLVGFPESCAGNLTSGGSMANLLGIVCARSSSGIKARDYERAVIYLTEHTHHCIDKALLVAGLGESVVRKVPTDQNLRMDLEELERLIAHDLRESLRPLLMVATAGTTNSGSVDPLAGIAAVARHHKIWLHVDGAYGGLFTMCQTGRQMLAGIGECDSVALDPPKGLYMPWGCGAILVRDGAKLYDTFQGQGAYMNDVGSSHDVLSPSDLSFELSKLSRGLKIWLPLKLLGTAPFAAAMEEKLTLARFAWQKLGAIQGFERGPEPDLSIVLFRYVPAQGDPNAFNIRLVEALEQDGRIHISSTMFDGITYLRLAILGYRTHRPEVELALELLGRFAIELEQTAL